jgi:polyisoprenoid-binding protein YceI
MDKLIVAAACLLGIGPAQAGTATYAIDPTHTFATFEMPHLGTSTLRVRFDRKQGSVQLDRKAGTGHVEITIDMNSVDSGVDAFDKDLRSKDVFDAATYPSARFVGDRFVFDGDKVSQVSGALTLHGQTHPLTLKATRFNCYTSPMLGREVCGGDFEGVIRRSRWGVKHALDRGFPDDVHLLVQIEAIRQ